MLFVLALIHFIGAFFLGNIGSGLLWLGIYNTVTLSHWGLDRVEVGLLIVAILVIFLGTPIFWWPELTNLPELVWKAHGGGVVAGWISPWVIWLIAKVDHALRANQPRLV